MQWLDSFFSNPVSLGLSAGVLIVIGLLSWKNTGRRLILGLSLFLYVRYMVWRGLYTLNTDSWSGIAVSASVYLAEAYGLLQFFFFTYQAWSLSSRQSVPLKRYPIVDVMVTIVNEPLHILKRTLIGCLQQDYPRDKLRIYVLDDGHRDDVKSLSESLGCQYMRRPDRPRHAKAGNLNYALNRSDGELIAVFDVDHVPVRTFLHETVGFFQDQQVAFVQTPHHFYNPDVFQRNLGLQREVKNEQALFFRMLQAGRDTHNSAFFAGSGGLFRRAPLVSIGGFQTETITEDIHTSMVLHAKGYKSCYLNKVLSAGLMPETFKGYLKQRTRWAIGCIQLCLKSNPLTLRGLTFSQRIDYCASVYYFFFGLPRLICLVAPLAGLFIGLLPLRADTLTLMNFFFSFYAASLITMRTVSMGTRNAFWSDVYEVAMSFSLGWAALKTLLTPRKERSFEVTPKGERVEKQAPGEAALVWPHLILFGLLVVGIAMGVQQLRGPVPAPGLGVSIFWACANLFLLSVAILSASEQAQWRGLLRLDRRFPCEVRIGETRVKAMTTDLSEHGAALSLDVPLFADTEYVTLTLQTGRDEFVELKGRIARQEQTHDRHIEVGVQFYELDDQTMDALIRKLFSASDSWADSESSPGMFSSFWSLVRAFGVPWAQLQNRRRRVPRVTVKVPCRIVQGARDFQGTTRDMSFNGIAAWFEGGTVPMEPALLRVDNVVLKVVPTSSIRRAGRTCMRFRVESIEKGEQQWRELHYAGWRRG